MGSAAEFHRVAIKRSGHTSDLNDSDDISVLVTEELEDAGPPLHLGIGQLMPADRCILENALVDQAFHVRDLIGTQGAA